MVVQEPYPPACSSAQHLSATGLSTDQLTLNIISIKSMCQCLEHVGFVGRFFSGVPCLHAYDRKSLGEPLKGTVSFLLSSPLEGDTR